MHIEITRAEGDTGHYKCRTMAQMDNVLWCWGRTAPERGGDYHKCDVIVTFDNEDKLKFRYDLTRGGGEDYTASHFRGTLRTHLKFHAGEWHPDHMKEEAYKVFLSMVADDIPYYKRLLDLHLHEIDNSP
jgi:hypothetical protein